MQGHEHHQNMFFKEEVHSRCCRQNPFPAGNDYLFFENQRGNFRSTEVTVLTEGGTIKVKYGQSSPFGFSHWKFEFFSLREISILFTFANSRTVADLKGRQRDNCQLSPVSKRSLGAPPLIKSIV